MKRTDLIERAKLAGYTVTTRDNGYTLIVRRHKGHGKILRGVEIWPDGGANRVDVDLSIATNIRSNVAIARCLSLDSK